MGFYAIMTSCLLLIFVPQMCPNVAAPDAHACSITQDFHSPYELGALALNFLTLAVMLVAQYMFWARETFIVEHLQDSASVEGDNLKRWRTTRPGRRA